MFPGKYMKVNDPKTVSWLSIYQEFFAMKERKNQPARNTESKITDEYKPGDERDFSYKNITSRMAVLQSIKKGEKK